MISFNTLTLLFIPVFFIVGCIYRGIKYFIVTDRSKKIQNNPQNKGQHFVVDFQHQQKEEGGG